MNFAREVAVASLTAVFDNERATAAGHHADVTTAIAIHGMHPSFSYLLYSDSDMHRHHYR